MTIEQLYLERHRPDVIFPDIWEHLPTLAKYAERVASISEIGTRSGNSTTGFLYGLSKKGGWMDSYDNQAQGFTPPEIPNVEWRFIQQDTHAEGFQIRRSDLLFIDGCHKYESVNTDLRQAEHATRFLILHDTSEARDRLYHDGVCKAMFEFLAAHPEWVIAERFENCNGLTVLERK